jgi:hypothetical protein
MTDEVVLQIQRMYVYSLFDLFSVDFNVRGHSLNYCSWNV